MSEPEPKIYKQTYSLDDDDDDDEEENSDSDSSVEVQYIKAEDLPKDELERIIATYKLSLESKTGQQIEHSADLEDETDGKAEVAEQNCKMISSPCLREDTNEEPMIKTIIYKTTYNASSEHHSSSEDSYDDSDDEPEAEAGSYKTIYATWRETNSSPEIPNDDDDDPDYEPNEKRIRFDTQFISSGQQKSLTKVLFNNDKHENHEANIRKSRKISVELQPSPGADFIKVPVPNTNYQKFKKTYRIEWEKDPCLKDWIQPFLQDSFYAYCKFCKCKLIAHKKGLRHHSTTLKHKKNVLDATGVWTGGNSKPPPNLSLLLARSRMRTSEVVLNEYDSSSLNFANSPDFNLRFINDPLLPIS